GHYKSDFPKLKNGNQGNQAGNGNAVARAYDVGTARTNPNSNVVTDAEVKSEEKRLEDVPIVQDFLELVRVPFGSKTLVFRGAESCIGRESRLTVISCSKVQEYMAKGCHVFLAQRSATKEDDKPERKQFKDVPIVQDFPEVFPKNLPGLPPARPV
nr:reverse transcriptase domain-containing protein [Tanacetum cinerariifolium]